MQPFRAPSLSLACLTILLGTMACGGDSSGPPSPPVLEASTVTAQTANAGSTVANPTVRVRREDGSAIAKAIVTFTVSGGGTIAATSDTTDASGIATAGVWRLGNTPGTSTVVAASKSVPGASVTFTATGEVGPAASLARTTGDGQVKRPGEMVSPPPTVTVRDAVGNPVAGVAVTFAVTAGGGSATGLEQTTNAQGVATVGSWTVGTTAGANTMRATIAGLSPVTFTATVVVPSIIVRGAGDRQIALPFAAVSTRPSVVVLDNLDSPVEGVTVNFAVGSGNGQVTGASAVTNAAGVATVGSWALGDGGDNTLVATVPGLAPVSFLAAATGFNIEVRYKVAPTTRQRQAFERAVFRWSRVIVGDQPNAQVTWEATTCFPALNEVMDDLVIYVDLSPIDGVGGTLGSAGPCLIRNNNITVVGQIKLDNADLTNMETNNTLDDVILHEMGHVLGIGTLWGQFPGLLVGSVASGGTDPYFTGSNALAAFAAAGGGSYTGNPVPVENTGGPGTWDGHWRETILRTELMTGFISGVGNPLSTTTIASLWDLGYAVSMGAADPYSVPGATAIVGGTTTAIHLNEVLLTNPQIVGPDGRPISGSQR